MDITSRKNEKAVHLKKLGASKEYRISKGEFLCDGRKLLSEAIKWGAEIHDVLWCDAPPENLPKHSRAFSASREVIEAVSPLKSPQDVVFSCAIPDAPGREIPVGSILLENMQDPGNVGAMLRTANAFCVPAVVLLGACADPWSPKTVRASMGAVFRQKIIEANYCDIEKLRSSGVRFLGAALGEKAEDVRRVSFDCSVVAIGNEGSGLSGELLEMCDGLVLIPMNPQCESLNAAAAAAVIMWEMSMRNI